MLAPRSLSLVPILALLSTACGAVHTQLRPTSDDLKGFKRVGVVMPDDGRFLVILESGKDNRAAMAGAAFGVLGALVAGGISEAHSSAQDKETAERLKPHLDGWSARATFVSAFEDAFRDAGQGVEMQLLDQDPTPATRKQFDAIATIRLTAWGLKMVLAGAHDVLAGFAYVQAGMERVADGTTIWDERNVVLGQRRQTIGQYERDGAMFRDEVVEAVKSAGYQTATILLYPRGKAK
jgi:hypothetical protein